MTINPTTPAPLLARACPREADLYGAAIRMQARSHAARVAGERGLAAFWLHHAGVARRLLADHMHAPSLCR
jgi:hypothetical protein